MKTNLRHFYWSFLSIVIISACSAPRYLRSPVRMTTDLKLWPQLYTQNCAKIQYLKALARLSVESPEVNGHMTVQVYFKKPDSLFIKAEGPLGIRLGKMFIGKNRFIVYNEYDNQFIAGNLTNTFISRFLQTRFTLSDLKHLLLGKVPVRVNLFTIMDQEHGVFLRKDGDIKYRLHVDPATGLLVKWELWKNKSLVYQMIFQKYTQIDGIVFPRIIQLIRMDPLQRISIFYKDLAINQKPIEKWPRITISPKVRQLNLE